MLVVQIIGAGGDVFVVDVSKVGGCSIWCFYRVGDIHTFHNRDNINPFLRRRHS